MKRKLTLMLALTVALLFAACGGDNHNDGEDDHGEEGGHTEGDDHADATEVGKATIGGYDVVVKQVGEIEAGKETIIEVQVTKDGNSPTDLAVTAWLEDKDGNDLTDHEGVWNAKEKAYDCHFKTPKDAPSTAKLWVRVGADKKSWDVKIHKD